jgi:cytochrome P450
MAEMVLHPEMQRKVHDEIDSVVGKDGELSESHIPRLPYLQAVIKETLRVHPPGPLLSWDALPPTMSTSQATRYPKAQPPW